MPAALAQSLGLYREVGDRFSEGWALNILGAATLAVAGRRRRAAAVAGGVAVMAGELCERWAVFKAGFHSARDPKYTVGPQRARLERRRAPATA